MSKEDFLEIDRIVNGDKTPINKKQYELDIISFAEDYTHSDEFKKEVKNEDIQLILRQVMDIAEGLKNIYSSNLEESMIPPDKSKYLGKVERLKKSIEYIEVK